MASKIGICTKIKYLFIIVQILTKRHVFNRLSSEINEPEVLILVGPRQVGKSTLLRELQKLAVSQGKRSRFFDLEQPSDLRDLSNQQGPLISSLTENIDIVFIDEFYYLPDAGKTFKAIYDSGQSSGRRVKIVVSGSSSIEIHSHLKESMAGRSLTIRIFPLSFEEVSHGADFDLDAFLTFGGLPGIAKVADLQRRQELLQQYLSTYIRKDIKSLVKEENIRAFNSLLYVLAQNQSNLLEVSSLAREVGLSAPALARYLDLLDHTYVNFLLPSYSSNSANELKKSRKSYLYDLGVRNSILKDFRLPAQRPDQGAIFESFVFLTLRAGLAPNQELRFWRTKRQEEIDFILLTDREPMPIEVKTSLKEAKVQPNIRKFISYYPNVRNSFTVSDRAFETIKEGNCQHHFLKFTELAAITSGQVKGSNPSQA